MHKVQIFVKEKTVSNSRVFLYEETMAVQDVHGRTGAPSDVKV